MAYFYLRKGVILASTGHTGDGKGDCIWRTAHFALTKHSHELLMTCADLLTWRRRWPEDLDDPSGKEHRKVEGFGSMTRDPYIMFYVAAHLMERPQLVITVKPPWYIWRPQLWAWRRFLITGKPRDKKRWERWHGLALLFADRMPSYATYLASWMAWVGHSEKLMEILRGVTPGWNLMQRQLVLHPLKHLDVDFILKYLPREGYVWNSEKPDPDAHYLFKEDEYKMDIDALHYIHNQNHPGFYNSLKEASEEAMENWERTRLRLKAKRR